MTAHRKRRAAALGGGRSTSIAPPAVADAPRSDGQALRPPLLIVTVRRVAGPRSARDVPARTSTTYRPGASFRSGLSQRRNVCRRPPCTVRYTVATSLRPWPALACRARPRPRWSRKTRIDTVVAPAGTSACTVIGVVLLAETVTAVSRSAVAPDGATVGAGPATPGSGATSAWGTAGATTGGVGAVPFPATVVWLVGFDVSDSSLPAPSLNDTVT